LYISFYSELGCKITIDPIPVKQVFANKRVQDAQKQQEGDGPQEPQLFVKQSAIAAKKEAAAMTAA
jgi:hypothetical protein